MGACGVVKKRPKTDGRVGSTFCVAKKGLIAIRRVEGADGVVEERRIAGGCIISPAGIIKERRPTAGCVAAAGIEEKRRSPLAVLSLPSMLL